MIGAARARILTLSDTEITVEVPADAETGIITVTVAGTVYTSTEPFTVGFSLARLRNAHVWTNAIHIEYMEYRGKDTSKSWGGFFLDFRASFDCDSTGGCAMGNTIDMQAAFSAYGDYSSAGFSGEIDMTSQRFKMIHVSDSMREEVVSNRYLKISKSAEMYLYDVPYTMINDTLVIQLDGADILQYRPQIDYYYDYYEDRGRGNIDSYRRKFTKILSPGPDAQIRIKLF